MKIIFLDIDGVLNCQNAYKRGDCKYINIDYGEHDHYQSFCPVSKRFLNDLIDETDAKVVISSSWRNSGLEWLRIVWEAEEMSGEIIDITPSYWDGRFSIPRGCEIDSWLEKKNFLQINWSKVEQQLIVDESGIDNFIIIDDDSDMLLGHKNHFVHVKPAPRNYDGFKYEHYELGKEILSKTITEMKYGE